MKILIADDADFMRGTLKGILADEGHHIIEAKDGKEAIEKVNSDKPDLLLLDIIMPEADGLAVLKAVKGKTKVIVISAVGQDTMVEEAKRLGALDYLTKPIVGDDSIKELLDCVKNAVA
jgi:two-component system, chemotaxis family, chemotaxis protein CheY